MRTAFRAAALSVTLMSLSALAQPPKPADLPPDRIKTEKESDRWMQLKLHASQEILAGLTRGDFQKIEDQSRRLLVLNVLETWMRENSFARKLDYQGQLNAFEYATKELVRTAQAKDIDGALAAYIRLNRSCVECHKLIRDLPMGK
jgi:hypothetical protein